MDELLTPFFRPTLSTLIEKFTTFSFFDQDFSTGEKLCLASKFKESLSYFEISAKRHFPGAYLALWWLFRVDGLVGPKDEEKAKYWLELSKKHIDWFDDWAETGNSVGMFWTGTIIWDFVMRMALE